MPNQEDTNGTWPLAYLLTWRTYGTWLPGDARGSVSRHQKRWGFRNSSPDPLREAQAFSSLRHPPVILSDEQRDSVETTVAETADSSGWILIGVSARTNHVHVLISAQRKPEPVMNSLKSWCTRRMRETGLLDPSVQPWAEHGSTRYLWKPADVDRAAQYILEAQEGERFETEDE